VDEMVGTVTRIVLTGGPGGGKSTLMHELRVTGLSGRRCVLVPEAASLVFQARGDHSEKSFQVAVVRAQMALEEACADISRRELILLCHRGTLDPLAYWLRNGWDEDEFFALTGMGREDHLCRYTGVVHLQTAAIDAENYYQRLPYARRTETMAQAAALDQLCAHAWSAHPHFAFIDNSERVWNEKAHSATAVIRRWLDISEITFDD
jgi:AAA domain